MYTYVNGELLLTDLFCSVALVLFHDRLFVVVSLFLFVIVLGLLLFVLVLFLLFDFFFFCCCCGVFTLCFIHVMCFKIFVKNISINFYVVLCVCVCIVRVNIWFFVSCFIYLL